jgi:hypothetical protein
MNGNFIRVNRQGADKIKVEGWLTWDAGDEAADLTITVTQNAVTASGSGHFTADDDTWDIEIELNGNTFSRGTASGLAGAVVTTTHGSTSQNWLSLPIPVN